MFFVTAIFFSALLSVMPAKATMARDPADSCYKIQRPSYLTGQSGLRALGHFDPSAIIGTSKAVYAHEIIIGSKSTTLGSHYLNLTYSLKNGTTRLNVTFSKTEQALVIEESLQIFNTSGLPLQHYDLVRTYDNNCGPPQEDLIQQNLQYRTGGSVTITTIASGQTTQETKTTSSILAHLCSEDLPLQDPACLDLKKVDLGIGPDGNPYQISFSTLPAVQVKSSSLKTYTGYEADLSPISLRTFEYRSKLSADQATLVFLGPNINRKVETISQEQWLAEDLDTDVRILNISTGDTVAPDLKLKLRGQGHLPRIFNSSPYFDIISSLEKSNQWEMSVDYHVRPNPASVPWNRPAHKDELSYLASTPLIQVDAAKDIADGLRPRLTNLDRIHAAILVAQEVQKHLRYDANAITAPDTRDILLRGNGICFHFSILFSSVARALGIPTRSIGGAVIQNGILMMHAWNEIKIDNKNWWPIEPQSTDGRPFQWTYIPEGDISADASGYAGSSDIPALLLPSVIHNLYGLAEIDKL